MSATQAPSGTSTRVRRGPRLSSATLKVAMAVTGSVFLAYVLVHMVGNLKVFLGAEQLDDYAAALRTLLVPIVPHESVLWSFRVVLLACLVVHVVAAVMLTRRSRAARGALNRAPRQPAWRSFTSRTMMVTGVVVGGFLVFHILDLTLGVAAGSGFLHPEVVDGEVTVFAYDNLVDSFRRPVAAVVYIVANAVLGAHLLHGGWSVVHDLGVTGLRARRWLVAMATAVAVAVVVGNIAIPVAVLAGVVR